MTAIAAAMSASLCFIRDHNVSEFNYANNLKAIYDKLTAPPPPNVLFAAELIQAASVTVDIFRTYGFDKHPPGNAAGDEYRKAVDICVTLATKLTKPVLPIPPADHHHAVWPLLANVRTLLLYVIPPSAYLQTLEQQQAADAFADWLENATLLITDICENMQNITNEG